MTLWFLKDIVLPSGRVLYARHYYQTNNIAMARLLIDNEAAAEYVKIGGTTQ